MTRRTALLSWHCLIVLLALVGVAWDVRGVGDFVYFTEITGACVVLGYLGVVVAELRGTGRLVSTIVRGACAMYSIVVTTIFNFLLGADLSAPGSLLLHLIVPLLVCVDWFVIDRPGPRLNWWVVAIWMVIPLAYLPIYTLNDRPGAPGVPIYDILNPHAANYWPMVAVFFGYFVLIGVVCWLGRRGQLPVAERSPHRPDQAEPSSAGQGHGDQREPTR